MINLDSIHVVNASAGSGKTYRLTELIVERVRAGHDISSVLATTFTKKAAAELTERIRAGLIGAGLLDQAIQLPNALIGTVNGVCGDLLAEYAVDAGLSPDVTVISETQQVTVFRIATDSVFDRFADTIEPIARRLSCNGTSRGRKSDPDWRAMVRSIVEQARVNRIEPADLHRSKAHSLEMLETLLPQSRPSDDRTRWLHLVVTACTDLANERRRVDVEGEKPLPQYFTGVEDTLRDVSDHAHDRVTLDTLPWNTWAKASRVYSNRKRVESIIGAGLHEVETNLLANPAFQSDLRTLTDLVFDCAAESISIFQEYKEQQGLIDFVDQETRLLELVESDDALRESLAERVGFVVVDEFQDTSPLQLELFVTLARLAEQSVWVGDPKQAIYGFRGTDPVLMQEVTESIGQNGSEATSTLSYSWRSKERLVEFSNALFAPIFADTGVGSVRLTIPDVRKSEARGGHIETWTLGTTNVDDDCAALARQIADFLADNQQYHAGDVAVLARTRSNVAAIVDALNAEGLKTSAPMQDPLTEPEMQLVMAGLGYLLDGRDTLALTELVSLLRGHPSHETWLNEALTESGAFGSWREDSILEALDNLRTQLISLTPLEAVEEVAGRLGVVSRLSEWPDSDKRRTNVDSLRALVRSYYDSAESLNESPSVSGFVRYALDISKSDVEYKGPGFVNVTTYHQAKGLEWRVVVLTSLDAGPRGGFAGVSVQAPDQFNPRDPLAGRWIRLWHDPFSSFEPWNELVQSMPAYTAALEREKFSESRLFYVGATRAKDVLAFAARPIKNGASSIEPKWCNSVVPGVLSWISDSDSVSVAGTSMPATGRELVVPEESTVKHAQPSVVYVDAITEHPTEHLLRKTFTASGGLNGDATETADGSGPAVGVELLCKLGPPISLTAGVDLAAVGNAVHGYLALGILDPKAAPEVASRLLHRHCVDDVLQASTLVELATQWHTFVTNAYPVSVVLSEHPIVWNTPQFQRMEGWIDALVKTAKGYAIFDHKTFSGNDPVGKIRAEFAAQLRAYANAITATGVPVIGQYIHMPLRGEVYEVTI